MTKKLILGALSIVAGIALATACSSSKSHGSGSGGTSGSAGTGGSSGSGGSAGKDGGSSGGAGGTLPYQDADLDAPFQFPDGGCGDFCQAAVPANCPKSGFSALSDCSSFCTQQQQGNCGTEWNAFLTCGGASPNMTCDANGQLTVAGCTSQLNAFIACAYPSSDGG